MGIIGAFTLHNVVPHIHHSHQEFEEVIDNNGHQHPHNHEGHHSDNQHSDTDSTEQFFLFPSLIDHHSHAFHTHEFTLRTKSGNPHVINKQLIIATIVNDYGSLGGHKVLPKYYLIKQVFFDTPSLIYYSLRGPPSLG